MKTILIVDTGTTSMRISVIDTSGTVIKMFSEHHPPILYCDGRVEQDGISYISCLEKLLTTSSLYANQNNHSIIGIALTSFRSAVLAVNKEGTPLCNMIMWQDQRTDNVLDSYIPHLDIINTKTGALISSLFSSLKMQWIRDNLQSVYSDTFKMVGVQDLMIHHLSGVFATDYSFAGRTSLLNIHSSLWDKDLLDLYRVEEDKLCNLIAPGSIVGSLKKEVALRTGILDGIPIISSGGDQQCAALGAGLLDENTVIANTGTGSYVVGLTKKPSIDPSRRVFCTPSALPGLYHLEGGMISTGSVYRWFKELLCVDSTSIFDFASLDQQVAQSPSGANGVIVLPHFKGSGSPYWNNNAKGKIENLTLSTTRGDIARAILESIALEIKENVSIFEELTSPIKEIRVSGGMAKSAIFNQIQADILQKEVIQPHNTETTSLGAWVNASVALGEYSNQKKAYTVATNQHESIHFFPNKDLYSVYEELEREKKRIVNSL